MTGEELTTHWKGRKVVGSYETDERPVLRVACRADLWCRKRTSVTTMLDPSLFERYTTGDDRIDEDWIVQTNPHCAFRKEFTLGCDALLALLQQDPGLHATREWLVFHPGAGFVPQNFPTTLDQISQVIQTAERELVV